MSAAFVVVWSLAFAVGALAADGQSVVGSVRQVVVASGDTLTALGSRHGVDPQTIAIDNGFRVSTPLRIGQQLRIDARHIVPEGLQLDTLVVNVPQRMLFLRTATDTKAWPVAVGGRSWPTPLGAFVVLTREEHPTWDVPASILDEARRAGRSLPLTVPPGPDNPLGEYWLGLSVDSVGIHGTNAPSSIYRAATHGCIRLHPDDIVELFPLVRIGTRGSLIYERVLVARDAGRIVMEVHPDVYHRRPSDVEAVVRLRAAQLHAEDEIEWPLVRRVLAEQAGIPRVVSQADAAVRPD